MKRVIFWFLAAVTGLGWMVPTAAAYPLTDEQRGRLKTLLPRSYPKLVKQAPFHVLAIGDSITRGVTLDEHSQNTHKTFHAVFVSRLEKEFFYSGGTRDIAPKKGHPAKLYPHKGDEITLENMGMNGREALSALQRLTTDGFVNDPDLVIISFGVNDARYEVSIDTYERALEAAARLCKSKGVDLIFASPTIVAEGPNPLASVGLTRPYAAVMEEVAERNGIPYADLGRVMMRGGGSYLDAGNALETFTTNMKSMFIHENGETDGFHINVKTHEKLGREMGDILIEGPDPGLPYAITCAATAGESGAVTATYTVTNTSEDKKKGYLAFLDPERWLWPSGRTVDFELEAGKSQDFQVFYGDIKERPRLRTPFFRAPVMIFDEDASDTVTVSATLSPIGVRWRYGAVDNVSSRFVLEADVVNGGKETTSGSYEAVWNQQKSTGRFSVKPGDLQTIKLEFNVPKDMSRWRSKQSLELRLSSGGVLHTFRRGVEASRNFPIGKSIPLLRRDLYREGADPLKAAGPIGTGVSLKVNADESAMLIYVDMTGIEFEDAGSAADPLSVELRLDARSYGKRREFGFVGRLQVRSNGLDGPAEVKKFRMAPFGSGYNRILEAKGVLSSMATLPNGDRRLSIKIPRNYFYLHEWALDNGNSQIGINAQVAILKKTAEHSDGYYPLDRDFILVDPVMSRFNALSLGVLELDSEATGRWSVRLY